MSSPKLNQFREAHRFFVSESPSYMAGYSRWTYILGFPRAYAVFMWMTLRRPTNK